MFIRLRFRKKVRAAGSSSGYPLRFSSLLVSVLFHGLAIAALALVSFPPPPPSRRPVYDLIRPYEHKIILYKLPKKLPDVTSATVARGSEPALGEKVAKRALIAKSPTPVSKIQLIQTPAPEVKLPKDIPLPDIIAKLNTGGPAIPDKIPARKFTPPARATPKLPMNVAVIDDTPPPAAQGSADVPALAGGALSVPLSIPSPVASKGNAAADVAVANLHPAGATPEIPKGDRPGRFSEAPAKGHPSEGPVKGALTVPNLSLHDEKSPKEEAPSRPAKTNPVLYAERVRGIPPPTLSAPLRPGSRTIPRAVEARFPGRSVYTMVIPIENFPAYEGDWIVWFAEADPTPGETPLMRAPVPLRTLVPVESAPGPRNGVRAQIAATLDKTGKLGDIAVLNRSDPATVKSIVADVSAWEFKPATRNGAAVNIQVVLEITFNLPSSLASRKTP